MRGNMVATDAQYLGIQLFEPSVQTAERSSLVRSTTGEVEDEERQHHRVSPPVGVQRNIAMMRRWQGEIWGNVANLTWHQPSPV